MFESPLDEMIYDLGFIKQYLETCPESKKLTTEQLDKIDEAITSVYEVLASEPVPKIRRIK